MGRDCRPEQNRDGSALYRSCCSDAWVLADLMAEVRDVDAVPRPERWPFSCRWRRLLAGGVDQAGQLRGGHGRPVQRGRAPSRLRQWRQRHELPAQEVATLGLRPGRRGSLRFTPSVLANDALLGGVHAVPTTSRASTRCSPAARRVRPLGGYRGGTMGALARKTWCTRCPQAPRHGCSPWDCAATKTSGMAELAASTTCSSRHPPRCAGYTGSPDDQLPRAVGTSPSPPGPPPSKAIEVRAFSAPGRDRGSAARPSPILDHQHRRRLFR